MPAPSSTLVDTDHFQVVYDAVPTTIVSIPLPENSSGTIRIEGLARRPSNGYTKSWSQSFVCKRGTGDAAIVGNLVNVIPVAGDLLSTLSWDIVLDVEDSNVLIQVKGQTSATVAFYLKILGLTIQDN